MKDNISSADVIIVNLSAMHKLKPIPAVLNEFAKLHKDYSKSWLNSWLYSYLWISWKYLFLRRDINEYKLGSINTDQFIEKLFDIFSFLKENKQETDPQTLLKDAWNSLIIIDENSKTKLLSLISLEKPVYFISNSNYLNIDKIASEFNKILTENWKLPEEKDIKNKNFRPINIARNFYMVLSFQCSLFKHETPGLIDKLINYIATTESIDKSKILLISQYSKDLEQATDLGIHNMDSRNYFDDSSQDNKKLEEVIDQDPSKRNSLAPISYEKTMENRIIKEVSHPSEKGSQRNLSEDMSEQRGLRM